jgi:hypothetical protein
VAMLLFGFSKTSEYIRLTTEIQVFVGTRNPSDYFFHSIASSKGQWQKIKIAINFSMCS